MANELELVIEPRSELFAESDARWQTQVNDLLGSLKSTGARIRREEKPVDGKKGGVAEIILALGSAGALTAAVEMFRIWVGGGRKRALTLKIREGGQEREVVVTAEGMSQDAVNALISQAFKK